VPTASAEVANVAVPPDNVPLPMLVAPSLNVTVPVGVPEPGANADIVAVNVTVWPNTDGLLPLATVEELESWFTVCRTAPEVLPVKLVSPL
jgi:hypothetical protein